MVRASAPARSVLAGLAVTAVLGICGKAFCEVARATGGKPCLRVHGGAVGPVVAAAPGRGDSGAAAALYRSAAGLAALSAAAVALGGAALSPRRGQRRTGAEKTSLRYTTKKVVPQMTWLKGGLSGKDLAPGDVRTLLLGECDICVGRTQGGKLFAVGDKAPPTGVSFSAGAEVQGERLVEPQYGNTFNVFTGLPEGGWCPSPLLIGPLVGAFMGGPQAVAVFQVREGWGGSEIEVLVDTNAKAAYEADYWKGILDAQGKDDGTYY